MRIHMNTLAAGPRGIFQGDCECPEDMARQFIAGGYAYPLGTVETEMLTPAEMVETRTVKPADDPVITWGQYKDMTVSQAFAKDPDYVRTYLTITEKDPAVAAAAKALAG